jgi:nucleoside-diphosphate-sugar epimerase
MDEEHPRKASRLMLPVDCRRQARGEFLLFFELPVATIRPFNTFGPRQSARAIIPTIISQALTGDTIKLGLLTPVRDFTFVEDTVLAFAKVANRKRAVVKRLMSEQGGVTIGELAEMIIKLCDGDKQVVADQERFRPQ